MGHDGMLYSLPSRDIIADSVEYMVNAHKADAMVCISNCDKITPGMLMAAMRLNIPTVFVSGGPMEAGEWNNQHLDLIDAMIKSADASVSDEDVAQIEDNACPKRARALFRAASVMVLPLSMLAISLTRSSSVSLQI